MKNIKRVCLAFASMISPAWGAAVQAQGADPSPKLEVTSSADTTNYSAKLMVRNLDKSIRFYTTVLGMKVMKTDASNHENELPLIFGTLSDQPISTRSILILQKSNSDISLGNANGPMVFLTSNIAATVSRVQASGSKVDRMPKQSGSYITAIVEDPDGRPIELVQIGSR